MVLQCAHFESINMDCDNATVLEWMPTAKNLAALCAFGGMHCSCSCCS